MPFHLTRNHRIVAIALSGALAVGLFGAGVAMAEGPGDGSGSAPVQQQGPQAGKHRAQVLRLTVKDIIKQSGLTPDVFKQGARDGKSIDQILTENGKSPADVRHLVLADLDTRLAQAVTNGKLTQAQADKIRDNAPAALEKLMSRVPNPDRDGRHILRDLRKEAIRVASKTIGIAPKELLQDLRGGQTIAQVAEAHGHTGQQVIDAMVAEANHDIDKLVANGKLTAEQGEKAKERALAAITKLVNEGGPHHQAGTNGSGQGS